MSTLSNFCSMAEEQSTANWQRGALGCISGLIVALVLVILVGRIGYGLYTRLLPQEPVVSPPTSVEVVRVGPRAFEATVPIAGTLSPIHDVAVFPKVGGKVVSVFVSLGQEVKQGQALARVEAIEYGLQAQQAVVGLEMAEMAATMATQSFERVQRVHAELGAAALPQQELDEARIQADGAKTQAEVARLNRDLTKRVVANATMVAPVDGRISQVWARLGAMVGNEFPAFQVADTSTLVVYCEVGDRHLPSLKSGQLVRLHTDALPGHTLMGKVTAVSPSLDPMTRRAPVEITVPNVGGKVTGNLFARGEIVVSEYSDAYVLPIEAVARSVERATVQLARDSKVVSSTVTVLGQTNGEVAVDGLSTGDLVILPGAEHLAEGEVIKVTIREEVVELGEH
ncbi:MAG: efflux RND transporter periplasmic adaptor subunit [Proteobacteria bacterium]|jgi:membrane fusion protein, multidrug efflux system|nr:efflux RND transporter periplasmic adaptor subunit [Pseudomonadota bacterium]